MSSELKIESHNLIVTEIITKLNERFAEHDFDRAACMVTLESIVASALVSVSSTHQECCELTHQFFDHVHTRVHDIIDSNKETRKDLN